MKCPNKTLKFDDQYLIPQSKLSQQGMITTGYRRGIKSIRKSAYNWDQCLICNTKVPTSGSRKLIYKSSNLRFTETYFIKVPTSGSRKLIYKSSNLWFTETYLTKVPTSGSRKLIYKSSNLWFTETYLTKVPTSASRKLI